MSALVQDVLAQQIAAACRPATSADALDLRQTMEAAGLDSLAFMEMVIGIENDQGITFDDEMLTTEAFEDIQHFIDYVTGLTAHQR